MTEVEIRVPATLVIRGEVESDEDTPERDIEARAAASLSELLKGFAANDRLVIAGTWPEALDGGADVEVLTRVGAVKPRNVRIVPEPGAENPDED